MIRSYKIMPHDLPSGRLAFDVLANLETGKLGYKIARNAQEFRRVDRLFTEEMQRVLDLCAWKYDGESIHSCADQRFAPEKYRGPKDDERDYEAGEIYSSDGKYYLVESGGAQPISLGAIQVSFGSTPSVYVKDPLKYRSMLQDLQQSELDIQLWRVPFGMLEEVKGVTPACFWVPMIEPPEEEVDG